MACNMDGLEPRLRGIEDQLVRYNSSLEYHIKRTDNLEKDVKESRNHRDEVLHIIVKQASDARKDQMRTIKIALGLFAAVATLITALAAWLH